jgi:hypothetical protein
MEVLAQDLGVRFEPFAAIFVPVLFRVLVITVQVRGPARRLRPAVACL